MAEDYAIELIDAPWRRADIGLLAEFRIKGAYKFANGAFSPKYRE